VPGIARRVGPYSRRAAFAGLDRRTREGAFAGQVERELVDHVGGSPTMPQLLVIRLAVLKVVRIALLANVVAKQSEVDERDDHQLVSWMNSLRRDLESLGLQRPERQIQSLQEYLASKRRSAAA
jgi:hypothetical protein